MTIWFLINLRKKRYGAKGEESPTATEIRIQTSFFFVDSIQEKGDMEIAQGVPCDSIVLNSTSITRRATPFIGVYRKAYCYLDNDRAGRQAMATLEHLMPGIVLDTSPKFIPHNDLNDYLTGI